jgi:hypothetical protein
MGSSLSREHESTRHIKEAVRKMKSAKLETQYLYRDSIKFLERPDVIRRFKEIYDEEKPVSGSGAIPYNADYRVKYLEVVLWPKDKDALVVTFWPVEPGAKVDTLRYSPPPFRESEPAPSYSPPQPPPTYVTPDWEPLL